MRADVGGNVEGKRSILEGEIRKFFHSRKVSLPQPSSGSAPELDTPRLNHFGPSKPAMIDYKLFWATRKSLVPFNNVRCIKARYFSITYHHLLFFKINGQRQQTQRHFATETLPHTSVKTLNVTLVLLILRVVGVISSKIIIHSRSGKRTACCSTRPFEKHSLTPFPRNV